MMDERIPPTILCLASYEKGIDFLRAAKGLGCTVLLLTLPELETVGWPRDCIDELYYMPNLSDLPSVINGVSYLARARRIDRIVPLDEYDVLTAAALREHLQLPGMGLTAARLLRDKLAMRVRAQQAGVLVPEFVGAFNNDEVMRYLERVPGPWLIKPRAEASTIGIATVRDPKEVWGHLDALGDGRSFHHIERFVPGDIFHGDAIVWDGRAVFAEMHRYGRPPLDVFHRGGIACSSTIPRGTADELALLALNQRVIAALGFERGITHMEFIKAHHDGQYYFLEVAARVGGAHIHEMIEHATGLNLWGEWARIEALPEGDTYTLPPHRRDYAGVIISLARQDNPDTAAYRDPEIVWRMEERHHVGFIVASTDGERLGSLLDAYTGRFAADFLASVPPYVSRPPSVSH